MRLGFLPCLVFSAACLALLCGFALLREQGSTLSLLLDLLPGAQELPAQALDNLLLELL